MVLSPMRNFVSLVTSLVFCVHATVGCNTLHAWSHDAADGHALSRHTAHDQSSEHQRSVPERDRVCPACSYVKADAPQFELSNDVVVSWVASAPLDVGSLAAVTAAVGEAVFPVDLSSTHLYVWHCALII